MADPERQAWVKARADAIEEELVALQKKTHELNAELAELRSEQAVHVAHADDPAIQLVATDANANCDGPSDVAFSLLAPEQPVPSEASVSALVAMGFSRTKSTEVLAQHFDDVERSLEVLLAHADVPLRPAASSSSSSSSAMPVDMPSSAMPLRELLSMGFAHKLAEAALQRHEGHFNNALQELLERPSEVVPEPASASVAAARHHDGDKSEGSPKSTIAVQLQQEERALQNPKAESAEPGEMHESTAESAKSSELQKRKRCIYTAPVCSRPGQVRQPNKTSQTSADAVNIASLAARLGESPNRRTTRDEREQARTRSETEEEDALLLPDEKTEDNVVNGSQSEAGPSLKKRKDASGEAAAADSSAPDPLPAQTPDDRDRSMSEAQKSCSHGPDETLDKYFVCNGCGEKKIGAKDECNACGEVQKTCPHGHPLRAAVTYEDGFVCNACEESKKKGAMLYGCRSCDYDVCEHCFLINIKVEVQLNVDAVEPSSSSSSKLVNSATITDGTLKQSGRSRPVAEQFKSFDVSHDIELQACLLPATSESSFKLADATWKPDADLMVTERALVTKAYETELKSFKRRLSNKFSSVRDSAFWISRILKAANGGVRDDLRELHLPPVMARVVGSQSPATDCIDFTKEGKWRIISNQLCEFANSLSTISSDTALKKVQHGLSSLQFANEHNRGHLSTDWFKSNEKSETSKWYEDLMAFVKARPELFVSEGSGDTPWKAPGIKFSDTSKAEIMLNKHGLNKHGLEILRRADINVDVKGELIKLMGIFHVNWQLMLKERYRWEQLIAAEKWMDPEKLSDSFALGEGASALEMKARLGTSPKNLLDLFGGEQPWRQLPELRRQDVGPQHRALRRSDAGAVDVEDQLSALASVGVVEVRCFVSKNEMNEEGTFFQDDADVTKRIMWFCEACHRWFEGVADAYTSRADRSLPKWHVCHEMDRNRVQRRGPDLPPGYNTAKPRKFELVTGRDLGLRLSVTGNGKEMTAKVAWNVEGLLSYVEYATGFIATKVVAEVRLADATQPDETENIADAYGDVPAEKDAQSDDEAAPDSKGAKKQRRASGAADDEAAQDSKGAKKQRRDSGAADDEAVSKLEVDFEPDINVGSHCGITVEKVLAVFLVKKVIQKQQAYGKGVRVGMIVVSVQGEPYTPERMNAAAAGHDNYRVIFAKVNDKEMQLDAPIQLRNATGQHMKRLEKFTLMPCKDCPQAPAKPNGFLLPLNELQRRTVFWMACREGAAVPGFTAEDTAFTGFVSVQRVARRVGRSNVSAQLRIERLYTECKGGLLADAVGYGKTASSLALIAMTQMPAVPPLTQPDASEPFRRIASKASLILVPPNLHAQWKGEVEKFLGSNGQFQILCIATFADLKKTTIGDLRRADVIITSARLLVSKAYQEHVHSLAGLASTEDTMVSAQDQFAQACDAWQSKKGLADDEWKKYRDFERQAARMGGVHAWAAQQWRLNGERARVSAEKAEPGPKPQLVDFSDKVMKRSAISSGWFAKRLERIERYTQKLISQGEADVDNFKAPALEMFHWRRIVVDELHEILKITREMEMPGKVKLKDDSRCVFHTLESLQASARWGLTATPNLDSTAEVAWLARFHRVFVPRDSDLEAQHYLDQFIRCNNWDDSGIPLESQLIPVRLTAQERALYLNEANSEKTNTSTLLQLCSFFSPDGTDEDAGAAVKSTRRGNEAALEKHRKDMEKASNDMKLLGAEEQRGFQGFDYEETKKKRERLKRLRDSAPERASKERALVSRIRYFEEMLKELEKLDGEEMECPICMESMSTSCCSVTSCGHLFCQSCIADCLKSQAKCPTCNGELKISGLKPASEVLSCAREDEFASDGVARFGSKVQAVCKKLNAIWSKEPGAKVIIFVQFEVLLRKMEEALKEVQCPCTALRGSIFERRNTIRQFQAPGEERMVLLLSLEKSPSGMNLVCCHHLVLMHPMDADSQEVSLGYERQAIGRVRRRGQQHKVNVYRFFAKETVEEKLTLAHHRELYDQQGAAESADLAVPSGSSSSSGARVAPE